MIGYLILSGIIGFLVGTAATVWIAIDVQNEALREHETGVTAQIEAAVQVERTQTSRWQALAKSYESNGAPNPDELQQARADMARWRDRALLCEDKGPTIGAVDEVYQENIRLKNEVAVLTYRIEGEGSDA